MMLLLCAFCFTTFAMPQQDTTKQRQDTTKKRMDKKSPAGKKTTKKKGWPANDTLKRTDQRSDTTMKPPQN
ncbi:hypothetical protein LY11_04434 [Pedobacter cryoconitis]|uniref:Uncharacterized protein n=2 Tax=Pedobacter cryoconitis TaxID=188932 RepID=A0A327SA81_9SPHI|nr:hypothetical protein LY11_04434 [Pedobacter cryoconitis]